MANRKPASDTQLAYIKEWDRQNSYKLGVKFNRQTDADILEWLERQPNKNGAIKQSLRDTIERERREAEQ